MAIGNLNYVRKHYAKELEVITTNFDKICSIWPRRPHDRGRVNLLGNCLYVNVGLEQHISPNQVAWHGVRVIKNEDGAFTIKPMSFYGRGCVTMREVEKAVR